MQTKHKIWKLVEKQAIDDLIEEKEIDKASLALLSLIEVAVGQSFLDEAEQLRERLIKVNPAALNLIIRAAELIDEAKKSSITQDHLALWSALTKYVSPEEFAALYHAMIPAEYDYGKMIVNQSEFKRVLFCVNSGSVGLLAEIGGKKLFLRQVTSGEIFGAENYFAPSVWTISARSNGAKLQALPYSRLSALGERYPALESKLNDYCLRFALSETQLKMSRRGRRKFVRTPVSGQAVFELLARDGTGTGRGKKGELLDLSQGGLSCNLHISEKVNASRLFGQKINALLSAGKQGKSVVRSGVVVAIKGYRQVQNEYALHVQFDEKLGVVEMQNVLLAAEA